MAYIRTAQSDYAVPAGFDNFGTAFTAGNSPLVIINGVIWGAGEEDPSPGGIGSINLLGYSVTDGSLVGSISVSRNIAPYTLGVDQNNYIWARHAYGFGAGAAFMICDPATNSQITTFGDATTEWAINLMTFDSTNNLMWIAKTSTSVVGVSTETYSEVRSIGVNVQGIGYDPVNNELWIKINNSTGLDIYNPNNGTLIQSLVSNPNTENSRQCAMLFVPEKNWMIVSLASEFTEVWDCTTKTRVATIWQRDSVSDFYGPYYSPATEEVFGYDVDWNSALGEIEYIKVDGSGSRIAGIGDIATAYAVTDWDTGSIYTITTTGLYKTAYIQTESREIVLCSSEDTSSTNDEVTNYDAFNRELILDLTLGAFSIYDIAHTGNQLIRDYVDVPPFYLTRSEVQIYRGNDPVTDGSGNPVTTAGYVSTVNRQTDNRRERFKFLITAGTNISLAEYKDYRFVDWFSIDGVGLPYNTYLLTGYELSQDMLRQKQSIYLKIFFERTEDVYTLDDDGNVVLAHQSGCKVQSHWNWNNSAAQGKWGIPFQGYRLLKTQPANPSAGDTFDYGERVIVTKNKLRGRGHCLSLLFVPECGKDTKLLGWALENTKNDFP